MHAPVGVSVGDSDGDAEGLGEGESEGDAVGMSVQQSQVLSLQDSRHWEYVGSRAKQVKLSSQHGISSPLFKQLELSDMQVDSLILFSNKHVKNVVKSC